MEAYTWVTAVLELLMRVLLPQGLTPPKLALNAMTKAWVALVFAVSSCSRVSHIDLLRRPGRSYTALASARQLLVWAFAEISDAPDFITEAWLEQCMILGRRSIHEILRGQRPNGLEAVLAIYAELVKRLGDAEVQEAVSAGFVGERSPKARLFPKGFLASLGLAEI